MRLNSALLTTLCLFLATGCAEDSSGTSSPAPDAAIDRGLATSDMNNESDATANSDAGTTETDGFTGTDGAVESDGGNTTNDGSTSSDMDVVRPDMMEAVNIDSCESACDRYESCGRSGDVFGDRAAHQMGVLLNERYMVAK